MSVVKEDTPAMRAVRTRGQLVGFFGALAVLIVAVVALHLAGGRIDVVWP